MTINGEKSKFCRFSIKYESIYEKKIAHLQAKYHPQKIFIFQKLVANFADFRRNNSVFMRKNLVFKIHHLQGKFIF